MNSKVRRIDFSADEYLSGIAGMPLDRQGMYWLICALIYSSGKPWISIEDERLIRLSGCHGHTRKALIARLIKDRKVRSKGSQISVKRCSNELQSAAKRSANGRQNALERWKNNNIDDKSALQRRNANHQLSTTNYQLEESPPFAPPRGGRKTRGGKHGNGRLSPVEGIYKGAADAIRDIEAERGLDQPPPRTLLGNRRT